MVIIALPIATLFVHLQMMIHMVGLLLMMKLTLNSLLGIVVPFEDVCVDCG